MSNESNKCKSWSKYCGIDQYRNVLNINCNNICEKQNYCTIKNTTNKLFYDTYCGDYYQHFCNNTSHQTVKSVLCNNTNKNKICNFNNCTPIIQQQVFSTLPNNQPLLKTNYDTLTQVQQHNYVLKNSNLNIKTFKQCHDSCVNNNKCDAFKFHRSRDLCWLLRTRENDNRDYKRESHAVTTDVSGIMEYKDIPQNEQYKYKYVNAYQFINALQDENQLDYCKQKCVQDQNNCSVVKYDNQNKDCKLYKMHAQDATTDVSGIDVYDENNKCNYDYITTHLRSNLTESSCKELCKKNDKCNLIKFTTSNNSHFRNCSLYTNPKVTENVTNIKEIPEPDYFNHMYISGGNSFVNSKDYCKQQCKNNKHCDVICNNDNCIKKCKHEKKCDTVFYENNNPVSDPCGNMPRKCQFFMSKSSQRLIEANVDVSNIKVIPKNEINFYNIISNLSNFNYNLSFCKQKCKENYKCAGITYDNNKCYLYKSSSD